MNITGIPDSIEWANVAGFIESLGIELDALTRDGIRIGWDSITCTVYARNIDGNFYANFYADDALAATHEVCIPVAHTADQPVAVK